MAYLRVGSIVTQEELDAVSTTVTTNATTADTNDDAIKKDLTTVALRQAIGDNHVAYNMSDNFIDQFEDDSGISSETTTDREEGYGTPGAATADEKDYIRTRSGTSTYPTPVIYDVSAYVEGYSGALVTTANWNTDKTEMQMPGSDNSFDDWFNPSGRSRDAGSPSSHSAGNNNSSIIYDFGAAHRWTDFLLGKRQQHGDWNAATLSYSADGSSWTGVNFTSWSATDTGVGDYVISGGTYWFSGTPSGTGKISAMGSDGTFNWHQFGTNAGVENSVKQKVSGFATFSSRYLRLVMSSQHSAQNTNASISGFAPYVSDAVYLPSATGTMIGTANVPSSAKTKVSGVMLYKDKVGTATIGTDLKIYFTCNNSNWTEAASYTAATTVFSTGIIMIKLGETTCTSGSDVRYKAVWANQDRATKETHLYGIGLNY